MSSPQVGRLKFLKTLICRLSERVIKNFLSNFTGNVYDPETAKLTPKIILYLLV